MAIDRRAGKVDELRSHLTAPPHRSPMCTPKNSQAALMLTHWENVAPNLVADGDPELVQLGSSRPTNPNPVVKSEFQSRKIFSNMDQKEAVLEWIRKTGYPLEMEVAKSFRQAGCEFVKQGVVYEDIETEKARECDIFASWPSSIKGYSVSLNFVIECKDTPSQPWVVFLSKEPPSPQKTSKTFNSQHNLSKAQIKYVDLELHRTIRRAVARSEAKLLQEPRPTGYSITQALRDKKNSKDGAYDAVRQVLASSIGVCRQTLDSSPLTGTQFASYWFPVVVTTSPLYSCLLKPDGDVEVNSVDRINIPIRSDIIQSEHIVRIVHSSIMDDFSQDCASAAEVFRNVALSK